MTRCTLQCIVLAILARAKAAEDCKVSTPDWTYDLCPLNQEPDLSFCKPGGFEGTQACYLLATARAAQVPCPGVQGAVVETLSTGLGQGCRVLGQLQGRTVTPDPGGGGASWTYGIGDSCGKGSHWTTTVRLLCDRHATGPAKLVGVQATGQCTYTFDLVSQYACPTELGLLVRTEHAFGHPTVVLILLLVVAAAYLAAGSYYKAQVLGFVSFPDYIPHIGFWRAYPGLVLDGVKYASSMISGGSTPSFAEEQRCLSGQHHTDRTNVFRDTFSNFVPHSVPGAQDREIDDML